LYIHSGVGFLNFFFFAILGFVSCPLLDFGFCFLPKGCEIVHISFFFFSFFPPSLSLFLLRHQTKAKATMGVALTRARRTPPSTPTVFPPSLFISLNPSSLSNFKPQSSAAMAKLELSGALSLSLSLYFKSNQTQPLFNLKLSLPFWFSLKKNSMAENSFFGFLIYGT
jgi:hypothetical protein